VFDLRHVQVMVLDEADRMFDLGFIKDIRFVLRRLPEHHRRLNMLFSATLSHRVLELAYEHMNDPELIRIEPDKMTVDRVTQSIYFPAMEEKLPLLLTLLRDRDPSRTMIFVNTRREADRLRDALQHNGIKAEALSGDVPQRKRLSMLRNFQAGELDVLIGTPGRTIDFFRRRQPPQKEADVLDETEVEHAVGLVEDHHLDVPQVEDVLPEEVDGAARRADQDVDARSERAALLVVVDTAEGEAERKLGVLREHFSVAMDLDSELARGREHERPRRGGRPVGGCRVAQQVRKECDQECGGLAGARLGLARDVEACERTWQGLGLDRCAALETRIGDAAGDGFRQVQAGKGKVRELLMCQRITTLGVIT